MATFNFDSTSNIVSTITPSVKPINKLFCGSRNKAGLWIADETLEYIKWRKECKPDCESFCTEHFVNTKEHVIQAATAEVLGRGIINPRMIIVRKSNMIRVNDKGYFCGPWKKGDGEIKNPDGSKKYKCAVRYLIVFVDEKNSPLHEGYIQLTAKGNFMFSFGQNYKKFREQFLASFSKTTKIKVGGKMNEQWYSMGVFVPTFVSTLVGKPPTTAQACTIESFQSPGETNETFENVCVGRNPKVNEHITAIFSSTEEWSNKLLTFNKTKEEVEEEYSYEE